MPTWRTTRQHLSPCGCRAPAPGRASSRTPRPWPRSCRCSAPAPGPRGAPLPCLCARERACRGHAHQVHGAAQRGAVCGAEAAQCRARCRAASAGRPRRCHALRRGLATGAAWSCVCTCAWQVLHNHKAWWRGRLCCCGPRRGALQRGSHRRGQGQQLAARCPRCIAWLVMQGARLRLLPRGCGAPDPGARRDRHAQGGWRAARGACRRLGLRRSNPAGGSHRAVSGVNGKIAGADQILMRSLLLREAGTRRWPRTKEQCVCVRSNLGGESPARTRAAPVA